MTDNGLSRIPLEWAPIYPMDRKDVVFDIFKHHVSYNDGLPPYAQARTRRCFIPACYGIQLDNTFTIISGLSGSFVFK
ncbi:MAG: hypothetical protein HFACDABA_00652 [Anaerolineales bacterium]|nr:hypothetical protein [Anaerolineales bacterium]